VNPKNQESGARASATSRERPALFNERARSETRIKLAEARRLSRDSILRLEAVKIGGQK
jgi:hypothetical protein